MRLLEFQVNQQSLRKLPGCDFSGIVAGSSGYLRAKFHFAEDWNEYPKKAANFVGEGEHAHAVPLDENNECDIPTEVLTGSFFNVTVFGTNERQTITYTKEYKVKQEVNTNNVEY